MSNFYDVRSAISALEHSKGVFDEKINMMSYVRTRLQNSWHTGTDQQKTLHAIQRMQARMSEGKNICQNAINEANAALQAAEQEKRRREEEERRRREAERKRREDEERRRREEEERRLREEEERNREA